MFRKLLSIAVLTAATMGSCGAAKTNDEQGVRDFISAWNSAYTGMNAKALAALEAPDYEMVDRFGHWIHSESPAFYEQLWAMTFSDIYKGRPGPARKIEEIRFIGPDAAVVQARAFHANGVTLDDGTRIPPFWEIDTYTMVRQQGEWKLSLLNIHNQIAADDERPGEHVPHPPGR